MVTKIKPYRIRDVNEPEEGNSLQYNDPNTFARGEGGGGGGSYVAGENIQINGNVISATDTTYIAGRDIEIVNGAGGAETVTGNTSILLENAVADGLNSVTVSGKTKQTYLPDGYTEYEYIHTAGKYFVTDYYPNNKTEVKTKIFMDGQLGAPLVARWSASPTNDTFGFYMGNVADRLTFFYGRYSDNRYTNIADIKTNIEHDIYMGVNNIVLDGTSYSTTRSTFTSTQPIYIGAFNQTGTSLAGTLTGRIYKVEFIENGNVVRRYIPCKNTNNEIGLYETATGTFITSTGTGSLKSGKIAEKSDTLPSDYTRLEYIQATGTQYLDSGVIANFATNKVEQNAVVEYTTSNSDRELMGTNGYGFWGKSASDKIEAALGQTTVTDNALAKNNVSRTTDPDGNKLTLNVNSNQYTSTASSFVNDNYAYYIFALGIRVGSGASASFFCKAKVYSYTIAIDDEVVCDLVPCKRNSDNVLGMYNLVDGTFKTNLGTGTFTAGNTYSVLNPSNPQPIISNNGELKVSKNLVKAVNSVGLSASKVYQFGSMTPLTNTYTTTVSWKGVGAFVPVVAGKTYTRSGSVTNAGYKFTSFYANFSDIGDYTKALSTVTTTTFTVPSGATYAVVGWIAENSGTTITFSDIQVELGSTATSYSPYGEIYVDGITETVEDELGNTATAEMLLSIGGDADTQEILTGAVTRKVGVIVLNGTENWGLYATNNGYRSYRVNNFLSAKVRDGICTHLPYYDFISSNMDRECVAIGSNKTTFYINLAGENRTVADMKAWLASQYAAGTPVMFIYPLETETTETVTGQTLTTIEGDNTISVTQASIDNLPIEANYDKIGGLIINYTGDDGADVNTKTFFFSGNLMDQSNLETALSIIDWLYDGDMPSSWSRPIDKNPIVVYNDGNGIYNKAFHLEGIYDYSGGLQMVFERTIGYVDDYHLGEIEHDYITLSITGHSTSNIALYNHSDYKNFLSTTNSTSYTPTNNYNPATKKYVDDTVGGAITSGTTAPSNPTEGQLWYDTTNDKLKVYDGTNWNIVGDDAANINTKTFLLASDSDKATATEAYKWFSEGNYPIIMRGSATFVGPRLSGDNLVFTQTEPYYSTGVTTTLVQPRTITFMYDTSTEQVTQILYSIGGGISVLETNKNYSTPYTPTYAGSPATKKYVDDSISAITIPTYTAGDNVQISSSNVISATDTTYNAGEGIEIKNGPDYSAMQGPAPSGYHVPSRDEWEDLKTVFNSLGLSSGENFREYFKIPAATQNYKDNNGNTVNVGAATLLTCTESTSNATKAYSIQVYSSISTSATFYKSYAINIRPFKDDAVIPDSSWATLYQGVGDAGIFYNSMLGVISISSDGTSWTTIADKNLGATEVYNYGDTITASKRGYLFQWGNDNGFGRTETLTKSSNQIDTTGYGPNNHYSSSTFITGNNDWSSPSNANLRGGQTGVVTINNAITNTGVLSVNGQTGNVTINEGEASSIATTQPSNPVEGDIYYDTTNDVLKVYDGTNWNVVGDDTADINTKTFFLSNTSDTTTGKAIYDRWNAGKNPIIIYNKETFYIAHNNSSSSLGMYSFDAVPTSHSGGQLDGQTLFYISRLVISSSGAITYYNKEYSYIGDISNTTIAEITTGTSTAKRTITASVLSKAIKTLSTSASSTAPSNPTEGQLWYDTTNDVLKVYDGTNWVEVGKEYNAGEGISIGNVTKNGRKGPSPDGFHVPSVTEWMGLKNIMSGLSLTTGDNWKINLHMPFAGGRDFLSTSLFNQGSYGYYWSSSPYSASSDSARYLYLDSSSVRANYNVNRANGNSVRCFKDTYVAPDSTWTVVQGTLGSAGIFWNQSQGLISITDGSTGYTIMDKNLGATTVYNDGDTLSQANMGNMYQWGNNYGFPSTGTITNTSSTQVDASAYGPTNPYSSDTFITGSDDWSSVHNDDLWGDTTGTYTLENAITNTGVTSVDGTTGDVTLKTINNNALVGSGNISLNVIFSGAITPAASSQYEGKIFYNTADKVFYTCDGTQWSAIGSGGFELAPNSPLSPKYRWYGTQAQYDALAQYYTDEVGDTVYYTI